MNLLYYITAILFCVYCVFQGAYFPIQYITALVLTAIVYISRKKYDCNISLVLFALMLIPIGISALCIAPDKYTAVTELCKYMLFPVMYAFFLSIEDKKALVKYIYGALILLAMLGVLVYLGIINVYDGMTSPDHGYRLQSVWQNANTNALFMGVGILLSINYILTQKKYICIIPLVLFFIDFYTAGSRTTLLITVAVLFVYLLRQIDNVVTKIIAIASIIGIIAVILLFGGRIVQISLSEATLVERIAVASDALRYVKDRILLGIGTGQWNALQYTIQTSRYAVKYVHCFPIQVLLDGGIFSLILYLSAVFSSVSLKKDKNIYVCLAAFMFLHSLLDFSLNYGTSIALFALFLSCAAETEKRKEVKV